MLFRFASFNLRYDKPDEGNCNWRLRREVVADVVRHHQLDLVGTQEGLAHQLLDLHRRLRDYQSVGGDRDGDGHGERCAIFYRRPWNCERTGDIWLSDTPEVPGSIGADWGNFQPRMATWGVFRCGDRPDAPGAILLNTHLDYNSAIARQKGVEVIVQQLSQLDLPDLPLVITGDFNCTADSVPRQTLQQRLNLVDVLAERPQAEQMTYHEFTRTAFDAVDSVYLDRRFRLEQCQIDSQPRETVYPSDHYPVIVTAAIA